MSRIERGIRYAVEACPSSTVQRNWVGAAIMRGGSLLAVASNKLRNIPGDNTIPYTGLSWHAEIAAMKMCNPAGATLYVARTFKDGVTRTMARPCDQCYRAIVEAGISRIYFTDWTGQIRMERL